MNRARFWIGRGLCRVRLHWIVWGEVWPASYDPPEPPEDGWICERCGYSTIDDWGLLPWRYRVRNALQRWTWPVAGFPEEGGES